MVMLRFDQRRLIAVKVGGFLTSRFSERDILIERRISSSPRQPVRNTRATVQQGFFERHSEFPIEISVNNRI